MVAESHPQHTLQSFAIFNELVHNIIYNVWIDLEWNAASDKHSYEVVFLNGGVYGIAGGSGSNIYKKGHCEAFGVVCTWKKVLHQRCRWK